MTITADMRRGEQMSDYVERQAVIDALTGWETDPTDEEIEMAIKELPFAHPYIIRCKDCIKHEVCRTSAVWAVAPNDDWYCADAERRTDEDR